MVRNEGGNIIITARYSKLQKIGILASIVMLILVLLLLYFGVKIGGAIYGIAGVFYSLYCGLKPSEITISSNMISAYIFFQYTASTKMLYFKEISKCKFTEDYDFILYDKDGAENDVIDIASFDKADIQVLLNVLSKYFPISLDNSLAAEGFTVPQCQTVEQPSSRKRRVVEEKSDKKVLKKTDTKQTPKNINVSKNGRKLEL